MGSDDIYIYGEPYPRNGDEYDEFYEWLRLVTDVP
jgi:hypothetical protein